MTRRTLARVGIALAGATLLAAPGPARSEHDSEHRSERHSARDSEPSRDSKRVPPPPVYLEECGACHAPYPGRLLDARSWSAVLGGLNRHFGVDASVDAETLALLRAYLARSAGARSTAADGRPLLRITETRWFRHEHAEVPPRLWREPGAVKPSDCAACHRDATQGRFSEHNLDLPRKGELR